MVAIQCAMCITALFYLLSKLCFMLMCYITSSYSSHSDIVDCKVSCKNDQENENNSCNHYNHPYKPGYVHCSRKSEVERGRGREIERELIQRISQGLAYHSHLDSDSEERKWACLSSILDTHGTLPDNIWMLEGGQLA